MAKIKFRTFGFTPERKPIKWNKKATWIMKGKEMVIQDYINENATGLSFYENLERLGSVESTIKYMQRNGEAIYGDFSKAITLENLEQQRNALKEVWKQLPYDERIKFGNSFEKFTMNGADYFTNIKNTIELRRKYAEARNNNAPTDNNEENKNG